MSALQNHNTKRLLWRCATAAALSCNRCTSAYAFNLSPSYLQKAKANCIHRAVNSCSSRMYSSNNNNDEDKSILQEAKSKVKSLFPFFKEETPSKLARKKAKNDISSGIDTILKDAPLGVRLMGKMVAPIIGKVAGTMAEAMEEQSRQLDESLDDARNLIMKDVSAMRALGEPLTIGQPFNQSSSSMSVNGKTTSNLQAQFEVQGFTGSGIATMSASNGKISSLNVAINGKNYSINVDRSNVGDTRSSNSPSGLGKNRNLDSDIIDVEFTDKVEK